MTQPRIAAVSDRLLRPPVMRQRGGPGGPRSRKQYPRTYSARACHHRQEKDPAGAFAAGFVSSRAISPGYTHASLVKDSASFPLSLHQCFNWDFSIVENEHCDGRTIVCLRREGRCGMSQANQYGTWVLPLWGLARLSLHSGRWGFLFEFAGAAGRQEPTTFRGTAGD